jgi:hypothetical protein
MGKGQRGLAIGFPPHIDIGIVSKTHRTTRKLQPRRALLLLARSKRQEATRPEIARIAQVMVQQFNG